MSTFFSELPIASRTKGVGPSVAQFICRKLTMEEVEQKVFAANHGKAAGRDGIPAVVWKQVVRGQVLRLFQASIDDGDQPSQWRSANIIL